MVGIKIEKLTKSFGNVIAIDNVSLEIKRGELFFLLGPSGCGKTTLLKVIAGFYSADEGEIYFDGRPMNDVPPHKRNTGMVFQNYALWPHLSVKDNVSYGLNVRKIRGKERDEKIHRALEIVQMSEYANRKPNQLSGGQQQRVALARALVIEPDAILLDEPLSNLDAKLRLEMRYEIKRIHQETGITTIYVTHDQKEALSMAERLAVMSIGKIEQLGSPREAYNFPRNKFVAEFIGETNFFPGVISHICENKRLKIKTSFGEVISDSTPTENETAIGDEVLCSVRPEAIEILNCEPTVITKSSQNTFEAEVESTMYLGEVEQYILKVGDIKLKAIELNPKYSWAEPGKNRVVSFDPQDVVVLPV